MRYTVERPLPSVYFLSTCIAFLLSFSLSVPGIIGHYTSILSGGNFLIHYIISFAYAVFTLSRLISLIKLYSPAEEKNDIDEPSVPEVNDTPET